MIDIKTLSDKELNELYKSISREKDLRYDTAKEKLWHNVRTAIAEYCDFCNVGLAITDDDNSFYYAVGKSGLDLSELGTITITW